MAWTGYPREVVHAIADGADAVGFGGVDSSARAALAMRDLAEGQLRRRLLPSPPVGRGPVPAGHTVVVPGLRRGRRPQRPTRARPPNGRAARGPGRRQRVGVVPRGGDALPGAGQPAGRGRGLPQVRGRSAGGHGRAGRSRPGAPRVRRVAAPDAAATTRAAQLRTARDLFVRTGADMFLPRTQAELEATGVERGAAPAGDPRPDRPGADHRAARGRRADQRRDRRHPVHQPQHRRLPPAQGLPEARHLLPPPARGPPRTTAEPATDYVRSRGPRPAPVARRLGGISSEGGADALRHRRRRRPDLLQGLGHRRHTGHPQPRLAAERRRLGGRGAVPGRARPPSHRPRPARPRPVEPDLARQRDGHLRRRPGLPDRHPRPDATSPWSATPPAAARSSTTSAGTAPPGSRKLVLVSRRPAAHAAHRRQPRGPADRGRSTGSGPGSAPTARSSTATSPTGRSSATTATTTSPRASGTRSGCRAWPAGTAARTSASPRSRPPTSARTWPTIDVPTLVIHGDDDQIVPFEVGGKRSAELVDGAVLKVYEGGAHGAARHRPRPAARRPARLHRLLTANHDPKEDRHDRLRPDTIVLVHGLWMTPRSWEGWVAHYEAKGYTVLTPGLPRLRDRGRGAAREPRRHREPHRARDRRPPRRGDRVGGRRRRSSWATPSAAR